MNKVALLVATAVTVVGIGLLVLYMKRFEVETVGGEFIGVLIVTSDIEIGQPIGYEHLGTRRLPESFVENRHIRASDRDRILGIRVSTPLEANQSLLWTDLSTGTSDRRDLSKLLREGMRALTINVDESSLFGGLLQPGDRVDVLFSAIRPDTNRTVTIPLLQNILVLSVGINTGGPGYGARKAQGLDVNVAVTMEQATMLTHAAVRGTMQLVLRNPDDVEVVTGIPETTDTDLIEAERRAKVQHRRTPEKAPIVEITGHNGN